MRTKREGIWAANACRGLGIDPGLGRSASGAAEPRSSGAGPSARASHSFQQPEPRENVLPQILQTRAQWAFSVCGSAQQRTYGLLFPN